MWGWDPYDADTPSPLPHSALAPFMARVAGYLVVAFVAAAVAMSHTTRYYATADCAEPAADCGLVSGWAGVGWVLVTLFVVVIAALLAEFALLCLRIRSERRAATAG